MTRYIAFGFQLPLPWRTDPPNFAAIRLRLLTLLRLGVAPVSVFLVYLAAPGPCQRRRSLAFSGSIPDTILYTPALRRVDSVPDSHAEFSELSADLPESRSFLREISTDFPLKHFAQK